MLEHRGEGPLTNDKTVPKLNSIARRSFRLSEEGRIEFSCCAMRFAELAMSMVRAGDCAQSSLVVSELHRPVPTYVHLCTECKAITFQAS